VGFAVDKVALGHVFLQELQLSLPLLTLPMLHFLISHQGLVQYAHLQPQYQGLDLTPLKEQ
jgi:hypothetical protein